MFISKSIKHVSREAGFTLIELLVVISIIALLLSILMPSLGKAKKSAQRVVCGSQLKQIGVVAYLYGSENDDWLPPSYDSPIPPKKARTFLGYYVLHQNFHLLVSSPYGDASGDGYLPNCDVLYCPSDKRMKGREPGKLYDGGASGKHRYEMSYAYYFVLDDNVAKDMGLTKFYRYKFSSTPGKSVIAVDPGHFGPPYEDPTLYYAPHEKGINALRIDGSVSFLHGDKLVENMGERDENDNWWQKRLPVLDNY